MPAEMPIRMRAVRAGVGRAAWGERVCNSAHSSRLDEFEGPGYVRVATTVSIAPGQIEAFIYVLRSQPSTS